MKWAGGVVKKWKMGVFFVKSEKWGCFGKKGGKWGVFFCIEVDLFSTQGALCTVGLSVFFILHFTCLGGAYAPNASSPDGPDTTLLPVTSPNVHQRF